MHKTLTFDLENLFSSSDWHDEYLCQVSLQSIHKLKRCGVAQISLIGPVMTLTSNFKNLSSNTHSQDEYQWHVSSAAPNKYTDTASGEIGVNRQKAGWKTEKHYAFITIGMASIFTVGVHSSVAF